MKYLLGVMLVFVVACGSVALRSNSSEHGDVESVAATGCGVERWPVKVMTDSLAASVNLTPVAATVSDLVAFPKAPSGATRRLAAEKQAYHIDAHLLEVKQEADSDFHLVISAGVQTMIAEAPDPRCAQGSTVAAQLADVRQKIILACGQPSTQRFIACSHDVWLTGVLFLDFLHGQTGVAPNGVELHPLLDFYVTN